MEANLPITSPLLPSSWAASHLHLLAVREVAGRYVMLQLNLGKDDGQLEDQLLFLVLLPKHGGHLLLQVADDVGVNLWGGEFSPKPASQSPAGLVKTWVARSF